jgi:hypothetical protein
MMDEKFFAWLDGELDGEEAASMEARVAADPALSRAAEEHRALAGKLRAAFDPVAQAPVPDSLQQGLRSPANVTRLSSWRERGQTRPARSLPQWAAIAATLVVGVISGTMIGREATSPIALQGGQLVAASTLGKVLETQLASAATGDTRVGLTFRDQSGRICRSFAGSNASGLACRNGGAWQVKGLFAAPEGQSGSYRMAAGADPNLAALIEASIAGEPFDAGQEAEAKARGWR